MAETLGIFLRGNTTLKHLHTIAFEFTSNGHMKLFRALGNNTGLLSLSLCGNYERCPGFISVLAEALKENTTLTKLDLSGSRLSPGSLEVLTRALVHNASVTTLRLVDTSIGTEEAAVLGQFLAETRHLLELDVSSDSDEENYNRIDDEGVVYLVDGMLRNRSLALQVLNLAGNDLPR